MKFQRDFFNSLRIKKLRRLAGGDTYTIIYLKLQLLSIVDEGYLYYKGVFETIEEELAEDIDEDVENIQVTMAYLLSCGLMEKDENAYYLPYAAENIGSESVSAKRVRDFRERQKLLQSNVEALQCNTNVTEMKHDCNKSVTERREDNIKDNINKEKEHIHTPGKEQKHKYGEYEHVLLKNSELQKLMEEFGEEITKEAIVYLDEYIEMKGYKAKNHYLCIRKWVVDAVNEKKQNKPFNQPPKKINQPKQEQPKTQAPKGTFFDIEKNDYDFDELERQLLSKPIGG